MPFVVVVTGRSGAGKTEISARISRKLGVKAVNMGDVLLGLLQEQNIEVGSRSGIGKAFFDAFSTDQYMDVVHGLARDSVVLDGVRMSGAVRHLKKWGNVLHVHRSGSTKTGVQKCTALVNGFDAEASTLATMADCVVDWLDPVSELDAVVRDELIPMLPKV